MSLVLFLSLACVPSPEDTGDTTDTADTGDTNVEGEAIDASALTETGGCGDVFMWAANAEHTMVLIFHSEQPLGQQTWDEGGQKTWSLSLPEDASAELQVGEDLVEPLCNDVAGGDTRVDARWEASAGASTLELEVSEDLQPWGEYPGSATLTLSELVFEASEGDAQPRTLDSLSFSANVGWMPG